MPEHSLPCKFVSKTMKYENLVYDHRIYQNTKQYPHTTVENVFGVPEHEEYQYINHIKNII